MSVVPGADGSTRDWPDPVLVGVDGSEQGEQAVRWAAREAAMRGAGLRVVHCWLWPLFRVHLGPSPMAPGLQAQAERVLSESADLARAVAPTVLVEATLSVGAAAPELLGHAEGAQLVVVGNRGLGGFTGLLLGSTGLALAARCSRPVAVVRGTATPGGPVVVGVDGSIGTEPVLWAAFEAAVHRRTSVVLVHAWNIELNIGSGTMRSWDTAAAQARQAGQEMVEKAVAQLALDFPAVAVDVRLGARSAAAELVDASHKAQLLVLGSGGAGAMRGLLLGSTTNAAVLHSACPVLIQH